MKRECPEPFAYRTKKRLLGEEKREEDEEGHGEEDDAEDDLEGAEHDGALGEAAVLHALEDLLAPRHQPVLVLQLLDAPPVPRRHAPSSRPVLKQLRQH